MVVEKAYAKLNLSLNILEKRLDGFHNLESIMVPVCDLFDILEFSDRDDNEFVVEGIEIPNNIIYKAAKLIQEKYHTKGANIKLTKRIPIEAGLAGGSADASATLRGLNKLFGLNLELNELEPLAASLGSDTVFCLYNKAAVCKGRGELLEFINFEFSFNTWILKPNFGLSTKEVFGKYEKKNTIIKTSQIISCLKNEDYLSLDSLLENDLYLPASIVNNQIENIIKTLSRNNITGHMSGSGSTIYFFDNLNTNYKHLIESNEIEYAYLGKHLIKNDVNDCL